MYKTEDVDMWLTAYKMFSKGFLPNNGGWLEQSNKFIQIMGFIDAEVTKHEQESKVRNGRQ